MTSDESTGTFSTHLTWPVSNNSELIFLCSVTDFPLLVSKIPYNLFFAPYLTNISLGPLAGFSFSPWTCTTAPRAQSLVLFYLYILFLGNCIQSRSFKYLYANGYKICRPLFWTPDWYIQLAGHCLCLDILQTLQNHHVPNCTLIFPSNSPNTAFPPHWQQLHSDRCSGPKLWSLSQTFFIFLSIRKSCWLYLQNTFTIWRLLATSTAMPWSEPPLLLTCINATASPMATLLLPVSHTTHFQHHNLKDPF